MAEKGKQFRWSKPMERVLLEILADGSTKGNKPSSTFKSSSITRVIDTIKERFGIHCEPDHVENHLKTIKNNWKTIQAVRGKRGFNWDDKMKIIIAEKNEFDQYVMAHPSHEKYLNKMIDMYDEMALVVGKDMATGSFAKQLRDIDFLHCTEINSSHVDLDDNFDELMKGSKTSSSAMPSEKRSHKRRKCFDNDEKYATLSTQLGEMALALKALGQSSAEHYRLSNDVTKDEFSKLYNEVMKVEGYDEASLGSIFDHLVENEKIANAFMVKSANLRKVWIEKFLSK